MNDSITITGNIAAEPELRRTPAGIPVATFRVASSQRHFDRAKNEWVETATNWYSISAFRTLAEHVCASLHKGERVVVTGRLRMREWETATKRGVSVEIDADALGHDLRWGTTRFERARRGSEDPEDAWSAPTQPQQAQASIEGAAWSADSARDWGAPADVGGEPALTGANAGELEPPF